MECESIYYEIKLFAKQKFADILHVSYTLFTCIKY